MTTIHKDETYNLETEFVVPKYDGSYEKSAFRVDLATFVIGPLCSCVALTLHCNGFPLLFVSFVVFLFFTLYVNRHVMSSEFVVGGLCRFIIHVFFREIQSRNAYKIPHQGPVIFVCAPHANQFLDPIVVMEFVPRPISFLIAAKSYRQKLVGTMSRAQRSIPVERPQDLAISMTGKITITDDQVVGTGTRFTEFASTDQLFVNGHNFKILSITDDTHMTIKLVDLEEDFSAVDASFKRAPKVDQHQMFGYVWEALREGNCVGIFPEGGSHDRSDLLPLKAGVAIMALGAAAKYPDLNIKLVTVGLNYFHGHRFRGRAYVEYGDPFSLPPALVQQYREGGEGKIAACNDLLDIIKDQLRTVTVSAPSWEQLQLLWAARRLYQPTGVKLPPKLAVILIRRFADGYSKVAERPEVMQLAEEIHDYNKLLKLYGLRDHQVPVTRLSRASALVKLVSRSIRLLLIALLSIPGTVLNLPILLVTRSVARKKATEALKSSTVKVAARDVLASWKVLTSLSFVPLVLIVYPSLAAFLAWCSNQDPLVVWGNFAVLQPFMMWAAVRSTETGWDILRSIKPLFLAVVQRNKRRVQEIRELRNTLKHKIRNMVNQIGPELYGEHFNSLRIFPSRESPSIPLPRDSCNEVGCQVGCDSLRSPLPPGTLGILEGHDDSYQGCVHTHRTHHTLNAHDVHSDPAVRRLDHDFDPHHEHNKAVLAGNRGEPNSHCLPLSLSVTSDALRLSESTSTSLEEPYLDEHYYHEERELLVPNDVIKKLTTQDNFQYSDGGGGVWDSLALKPMDDIDSVVNDHSIDGTMLHLPKPTSNSIYEGNSNIDNNQEHQSITSTTGTGNSEVEQNDFIVVTSPTPLKNPMNNINEDNN